MKTLAQKILDFHFTLNPDMALPDGVQVMNPFAVDEVRTIASEFYFKYYNDRRRRRMILGINPGRLGAGATGIPFTDTKRLTEVCGIDARGLQTHEPSSVFVYDVIRAFGGAEKFYSGFYINSICPLGFVHRGANGKMVNHNYYDSRELMLAATPFIIASIGRQLEFGIERDVCFLLGSGKNARFFSELNKREKFFENIVPLDHPRFIMQYRLKKKNDYVEKYLDCLRSHELR